MMRRALVIAVILGCSAALVGGCGGDSGNNGGTPEQYNKVRLDPQTLPPLGDQMMYELWAVPIAEELAAEELTWVSFGKFNVILDDGTYELVDIDGNVISNGTLSMPPLDLKTFDSLIITVESDPDTDTLPSASAYLQGNIDFEVGYSVALRFPADHLDQVDDNAWFSYGTPTDTDTGNGLSGVWFMIPIGLGSYAVGLIDLDPAPEGWVYQGWVRHDTHLLSTGRFRYADSTDWDAPYSANEVEPPSFPGEDFLMNSPVNGFEFSVEDSIWITVEPLLDPDPLVPFPYTLYSRRSGQIPATGMNFRLDMRNEDGLPFNPDDFPHAVVWMEKGPIE